jgi:toxin ParE1/3/4
VRHFEQLHCRETSLNGWSHKAHFHAPIAIQLLGAEV